MKRLGQNGFGAVEALLLVVLIGLIGGTSFYVYKAQKSANKSLDSASKNLNDVAQQNQENNNQPVTKEEDSWLLFEASDKAYRVRIPDGWEGVALDDNVYVRDSSKMTYVKGTKAKIEVLDFGGWDGPSPFSLYLPRQNYDQIVKEGTKEGEIVTEQGLKVEKYKYLETKDPEGIGYQKGDTAYNYYFGADGKYIQVTHYFAPGGSDHSELVERLVKTIKVN